MKKLFLSYLILLIGFIFFSSCSKDPKHPAVEYMPDMYRSPSYNTYSPNPNFSDGMTARNPVKGTIPRNYTSYPYPNTFEGYEAAGAEFKNPLPKTPENLTEGKRLYDIFCTHCHGIEGKGDGTIIQNGKFPPVPSYSGQLKDLSEGKMFHSITYGKNLMGPHASQITAEDRWRIIMYIQTLQKPITTVTTNASAADTIAKP